MRAAIVVVVLLAACAPPNFEPPPDIVSFLPVHHGCICVHLTPECNPSPCSKEILGEIIMSAMPRARRCSFPPICGRRLAFLLETKGVEPFAVHVDRDSEY